MHRTGASRTGLPVLSRRRSHNHQLAGGTLRVPPATARLYARPMPGLRRRGRNDEERSVAAGSAVRPAREAVQGREVARRVQFEHRAVTIGPAEGGRTIYVVLRIPGQGGRWSSPIRPVKVCRTVSMPLAIFNLNITPWPRRKRHRRLPRSCHRGYPGCPRSSRPSVGRRPVLP